MAEIHLPHNLDAERTILGAVLIDRSLWAEASALGPDDFFLERHRTIFGAMGRLAKRDAAIDLVTVAAELQRSGQLEAVGGRVVLAGFTDGLPRVTNIGAWISILQDHAARRRLILEGHRIAEAAQSGEKDPEEILKAARAAMEAVQKGRGSRLRALWEGVRGAVGELDRFDSGDFSTSLSTGIVKLDKRLRGGLVGGRLYLVCAPSGSGKSSLCQQLVRAASEVGPVLFVSPEMSLESLVTREIVSMSRCEEWSRNPWGLVSDAEKFTAQEEHGRAASQILRERRPIMVLDDASATMDEIEAAADSMVASGLSLVVIDYAQQVADGANVKQRYLEVGDVARRSVALALRLNIPVVVASQVNVTQEKGKAKEYSAYESKVIEQKAHATFVIEVNYADDAATSDGERVIDSAYIVCKKNRSGPMFRLRVQYDPHLFLIRDYEPFVPRTFTGGMLPPAVPGD